MGKMSDYGLPDPDHLIGEAHPTISSDLPVLVACGDISVKREIVACQGNDVFFADETHRRADVIIFATGYKIEFPFLPESHIQVRQNALPLYLRSFHPLHRRLFFVGLLQTVGAVFPTAEAQAELIALHLSGEYNLPPTHEMLRDIERRLHATSSCLSGARGEAVIMSGEQMLHTPPRLTTAMKATIASGMLGR